MADGNESWLDELPGMVDSLAQEWSLTIGSSLAGGHVALVVEVTLADGTPAVLKIGVPGRDIGPEATLLRLADGGGCAKRLASRTGVDATAIWEWGTIHRVFSGVYACSIGFQPFGELLLAEADRLTA